MAKENLLKTLLVFLGVAVVSVTGCAVWITKQDIEKSTKENSVERMIEPATKSGGLLKNETKKNEEINSNIDNLEWVTYSDKSGVFHIKHPDGLVIEETIDYTNFWSAEEFKKQSIYETPLFYVHVSLIGNSDFEGWFKKRYGVPILNYPYLQEEIDIEGGAAFKIFEPGHGFGSLHVFFHKNEYVVDVGTMALLGNTNEGSPLFTNIISTFKFSI